MKKPTGTPAGHPRWLLIFLFMDLLGLFLFLLGLHPGLFGLDRSYVIGYLQTIVFLIGLGLVVLSTYALETLMRPAGQPLSIREDIGVRLAATGYVLFTVSCASDLIGLGSHPLPGPPHMGVLQSIGLLSSSVITILGLFMYIPGRKKPEPPKSSEKSV
jgi:hypothetical protein